MSSPLSVRADQGLRSSRDGVRRQGGIRTIRPLQAQRPKRVAVTKQRAELHVDEVQRILFFRYDFAGTMHS